MGAQSVQSLSLGDAKKACQHLIANIYEFVDSVDKTLPGNGYDVLAKHLTTMNADVQKATGPFMTNDTCDKFIGEFLLTFTKFNPSIEQNLTDFNDAYTAIADFFTKNQSAGTFQLTDYGNDRIEQMIKINNASNEILTVLRKNPKDIVALYASFAVHSSKTEMSEYGILNELKKYEKIMKTNSAQVNFDPVKIFSIHNQIKQRDGTFGTEARTIRNLLDHHNYDLNDTGNAFIIHFESKYQENGKSVYEKTFTAIEFCNYLALLDAFYKCVVNILFCYQLLAVLRAKFVTP